MLKKKFNYMLIFFPIIILSIFTQPQEIVHSNKSAPWILYRNNKKVTAPIIQKNNNKKIFYKFRCKNNLKLIYMKAIDKWNKLNVIKFIYAENNLNKNINPIQLYGEKNLTNNKIIATTSSSRTPITRTKNGNLIFYYHITKVNLNKGFKKFPKNDKINIITHELGHCLGLDDDYNKYIHNNIMNPTHHKKENKLSRYEKIALKYYYSL